ncbi:hypothetical protein AtubIFM56815_005511 [Aspergillus tubingensis]|uniref:Uncharacterized protein n=1 Tax=Aspergillus tubingensis TaxID=5068 RepID=A0A9W6EQS1_ASPTU|nr:hypothetical protein AtubIFM56815_005511 [Aspergillus tubingensis]
MYNCFRAGNKIAPQYPVYLGWPDGVRFLAQDSADIDALPPHPGGTAYTGLGHAIEERGHRMIQLLLNADIHDDVSSSAFTFTLEYTGSLDIIDLQLKYGPGFNNLIGKE